MPYIRTLVTLIENHLEEIDTHIRSALDNWHLDRVSSIDRGILRIAAVEISYLDEVPPKVSIQEAILLAEAYGGSDSPRFVNGVLDAVFKDQSKNQTIPQNLMG
jgi:N utilization substance protein B